MIRLFTTALLLTGAFSAANHAKAPSRAPAPYYYQILVYRLQTPEQERALDAYLESAYVPALHRAGIPQVGVFKPVPGDTLGLRMYVFIPFRSLEEFSGLSRKLAEDQAYQDAGKSFLEAPYNQLPYVRIESILLKAFDDMPKPAVPDLVTLKGDRVYELRSYESPTEAYHENKVHMFNQGGEIGIFSRLKFNAVFYASVISGSHMPNLMYMTTFDSKLERDQHWKAFGSDTLWKRISASPEYAHNVSHIDDIFLYPTDYSDF